MAVRFPAVEKQYKNLGIERKRLETQGKRMAPQVGLEPTTLRLTAECSAIELLRNIAALARLVTNYVTKLRCELQTDCNQP